MDRLTKVLLAAIAIALWINAINPWIRAVPAAAQAEVYLSKIQSDVSSINPYIYRLQNGTCTNSKLC